MIKLTLPDSTVKPMYKFLNEINEYKLKDLSLSAQEVEALDMLFWIWYTDIKKEVDK